MRAIGEQGWSGATGVAKGVVALEARVGWVWCVVDRWYGGVVKKWMGAARWVCGGAGGRLIGKLTGGDLEVKFIRY